MKTPTTAYLSGRPGSLTSEKSPPKLMVYGVGGVLVSRSTTYSKEGARVVLTVPAAKQSKLTKETSKRVRALLSSPISSVQRERAHSLAQKARAAQASPVTAKFRKMVHAFI